MEWLDYIGLKLRSTAIIVLVDGVTLAMFGLEHGLEGLLDNVLDLEHCFSDASTVNLGHAGVMIHRDVFGRSMRDCIGSKVQKRSSSVCKCRSLAGPNIYTTIMMYVTASGAFFDFRCHDVASK